MNYENSKSLTDIKFKRLVCIQRETFVKILQVLNVAYLQYLREYRTYEQIAADFGIHESHLIRRSKWVEDVLIKNGVHTAGRDITSDDTVLMMPQKSVFVIPKKKQHLNYSGKKKCHTAKVQITISATGGILRLDYTTYGRTHDFHLGAVLDN